MAAMRLVPAGSQSCRVEGCEDSDAGATRQVTVSRTLGASMHWTWWAACISPARMARSRRSAAAREQEEEQRDHQAEDRDRATDNRLDREVALKVLLAAMAGDAGLLLSTAPAQLPCVHTDR